jgi:hypothetical protein
MANIGVAVAPRDRLTAREFVRSDLIATVRERDESVQRRTEAENPSQER